MKLFFVAVALCAAVITQAQNVGIGTSFPDANAKLDITATDKGILIPRMDSTHRKSIANTIGLLVYDSTTQSFWYNDGKAWQNMSTANTGWSLTGNSGTDISKNFLGTTDNTPLLLRINNIPAGLISRSTTSIGSRAYNNFETPEKAEVTAFGQSALANFANAPDFAGIPNSAFGVLTLTNNTTGMGNTALGGYSLTSNVTGIGNTAGGARSLYNNNSGNRNTAFGLWSLTRNTGSYNSSVGAESLFSNGGGDYNTAIGAAALYNTPSASGNTAVGYKALYNWGGEYNTAIGANADFALYMSTISNATAIGANAKVDASNKIRLGDANVTVVESNGVFNTVSDGRFKYNIQENVKGLDFILKLRPVTYQFDTKKQESFIAGKLSAEELNSTALPVAFNETDAVKRTGFIAQEVAAAAQKSGYDFDGVKIPANDKQYYSLSYASFVVPLVKAMQEQQRTIDALNTQNELLKKQNEMILKRLEAIEKKH